MATLQVKGMDDGLYEALRKRARLEKRSVSREVVKILEDVLSTPPEDPIAATRAFLAIAGTWQDDRSAEQIMSDIRSGMRSSGRRDRALRHAFD